MSHRARVGTSKYKHEVPFRIASINSPRCPDASVSSSEHFRFLFPLWFSHGSPKSKKNVQKKHKNLPSPLTPTGSGWDLHIMHHTGTDVLPPDTSICHLAFSPTSGGPAAGTKPVHISAQPRKWLRRVEILIRTASAALPELSKNCSNASAPATILAAPRHQNRP